MNTYVLLPLASFFANLILACYVLYKNPTDRLNKLYCLFAAALATWAIGDFLTFSSTASETALYWSRLTLIGACLTVTFLLHFFLIFTKSKLIFKKLYIIPLYLPSLVVIFLHFTTNMISKSAEIGWWGYDMVRGILYIPYTFFLTGYIIIGFLICYKFYSKITFEKEKVQIKLIIIGVSIPLIGGVITQIIPVVLGFKMIPLTSTLTTFTAVTVAYGIVKYGLMNPISLTIRRKIIAGFIIVIILVSTTGFFSIAQSQEFLHKSIGEGSRLLARESMDKISSVISHRIEEIQFQAHSSNSRFQDLVKKSNQEFSTLGSEQEIYNYIVEKDMEWVSASKNETTYIMKNVLNSNISKNLKKSQEFYKKMYDYILFGEIFVTNKYGANIGSTGRTSDYYQADEEWWQNGKKYGLNISDVSYDASADMYSIDIISRIDDENGDFIGILKAVWNVEEMVYVLENSLLSKGNDQYSKMNYKLLNKDGKVIYSSKKFVFLEDDSNLLTYINNYSVEQSGYIIIGGAENEERGKLVAYSHSEKTTDFNDLNWILTLEYDIEDVFSPVLYLQNLILLVSCIIAMIGLLFGFLIANSLSKPIVDLKNIAHKMGEGNLDVKIDVKSNDEVGDLAFNFKIMAKSLKNNRENLESQVVERTGELNNKIKELERFKELTVGRELKMIEIKKQIKELKTKLPERDKWS